MQSIHKLLTLLFLLAALVLAAPPARPWDGLSARPPPEPEGDATPTQPRPGQPSGTCKIKDKVVFDAFTVHGYKWNVTEEELKAAIKSKGAITGWKYRNSKEYDSEIETFEAKFNLPIGMNTAATDKMKELVAPWEMDFKCKRHHDHAGSYGTNHLPPPPWQTWAVEEDHL